MQPTIEPSTPSPLVGPENQLENKSTVASTGYNSDSFVTDKRRLSYMLAGAFVLLFAVGGMYKLAGGHAAGVPSPSSSPATAITIDGTKTGPAFMGLGAISGGGGNSRLLIDYPEPERSQILDYMFKPNYGASVQLLKLEIGGDANSTDGAEQSIEHTKGQINCNAGYEWWMAEQAVARNPNIKLYGLQWTAPGWTGDGAQTIWTQDNVNYVISWMNCAKSHNLTVSYLGGWNERGYNATWYENLRKALNANGYTGTQIVAADEPPASNWAVATAMASTPALNSAISIVGEHDPCDYPTDGYTCTVTAKARTLNKPLWASEIGAMDANANADALVRAVNNGYNQASFTGFLMWPIIDAMPAGLPHENFGLLTADQPWSGNYSVNKMTWAFAQITQFAPIGWLHIGGANKAIGTSGTYNTYQAPDHSAWSMVAENTGSSSGQTLTPQTINVTVQGGLPSATVHVWSTNLESNDPTQWFQQQSDITPTNGTFSYTIPAGYVVTFTTTTGQSKGTVTTAPPAAAPLALPYTNSLATDDGSDEASFLSAQDGAFEITPCLGGISGNCVQQNATQYPVYWRTTNTPGYPYATIGDGTWSNYTVSSNILFPSTTGSGGVIGRFSNRATGTNGTGQFSGYLLHLTASGTWKIYKNSATATPTTLAAGTVKGMKINTWHTLSLSMQGSKLTASLDGTVVGSITDSSYASGQAGIEAGAFVGSSTVWPSVQYSALSVK